MKPSKYMYNLLHVLPAFVDEERNEKVYNTVWHNWCRNNKLNTGQSALKLDRVGYSSLAYPVAYGAIQGHWMVMVMPLMYNYKCYKNH